MLKKAVQQGHNERRGEGVRFGTMSLSEARTPLADFFSILIEMWKEGPMLLQSFLNPDGDA